MSLLENISDKYRDIPYMGFKKASFLRNIIVDNGYSDLLELGFFHGKSSLLFAAILEDKNKGHLTTLDLFSAKDRTPNIDQLLGQENLSHRVSPVYCYRSYNWELMKLIQDSSLPRYDFCYLDGGHTLDHTGLGFFLVDKLLHVGGTIVFDDLDWTLAGNPTYKEELSRGNDIYASYCTQEKNTPAVRLIFENLVQRSNYECTVEENFNWGLARKIK